MRNSPASCWYPDTNHNLHLHSGVLRNSLPERSGSWLQSKGSLLERWRLPVCVFVVCEIVAGEGPATFVWVVSTPASVLSCRVQWETPFQGLLYYEQSKKPILGNQRGYFLQVYPKGTGAIFFQSKVRVCLASIFSWGMRGGCYFQIQRKSRICGLNRKFLRDFGTLCHVWVSLLIVTVVGGRLGEQCPGPLVG